MRSLILGQIKADIMSQTNNIPALLGEALLGAIRQAVREEFQNLMGQNGQQNRRPVEAANPYLTVKEAANLSRLASSTIRLYIRRRELKAHQVGSRVIIKRADLERFLEAHPIEVVDN